MAMADRRRSDGREIVGGLFHALNSFTENKRLTLTRRLRQGGIFDFRLSARCTAKGNEAVPEEGTGPNFQVFYHQPLVTAR
jgi:hypothetical protein